MEDRLVWWSVGGRLSGGLDWMRCCLLKELVYGVPILLLGMVDLFQCRTPCLLARWFRARQYGKLFLIPEPKNCVSAHTSGIIVGLVLFYDSPPSECSLKWEFHRKRRATRIDNGASCFGFASMAPMVECVLVDIETENIFTTERSRF